MSRVRHLKKKYGITEDEYQTLVVRQRECCAICGRHSGSFQKKLAVDHDHETGEIRGALCVYCNRYVVGRYRRKDITLLKNLVKYLEDDYTGWIVPPKKKRRRKRTRK